MPIRFYRRFRSGPFRLNLSKRGASMSVGTKGAWFTAGHGRTRTSIGVPGTGLGWYEQHRLPRSTSAPAAFLRSLAFVLIAVALAALLLWH